MLSAHSETKRAKDEPIRVLLAKIGLDGHDRGLKIVAQALREASVEVLYLGVHHTPEEIVRSAVESNVAMIGLSIHSAAHTTLVRELVRLLKKSGVTQPVVFVGGIIPAEDIPTLKKIGVRATFGPAAPLKEIVEFVTSAAKEIEENLE